MKDKVVNFHIKPEMAEMLEKARQIDQRTLASLSRIALTEYCQKVLQQQEEEKIGK